MSNRLSKRRWVGVAVLVGCLAVVVVAAVATRSRWLAGFRAALVAGQAADGAEPEDRPEAVHIEPDQQDVVHLTERGLKNIGFEPFTVEFSDYQRTLKLPAIVVERPGRSQIHITAPLTGVVATIHAVTGEAVGPGAPLFELRLTHEELVAAQREFLQTTANLRVVEQELARLRELEVGVVAGKRILEQQYEKQKLEVGLQAAEQAMALHGLTERQIDDVRQSGRLFRNITIRAPQHTDEDEACEGPHLFSVQNLAVAQGEHVELGRELAMLADHCELYIEALAFEDDAPKIRRAAESNWNVTATLPDAETSETRLTSLEVVYVAGQIDPETRAFKVYVRLPNRIALDRTTPAGRRFTEWAYKPGQRMQVNVPVEVWRNQLVLPASAVIDQGAEAYVYRQNGDQFQRVSVQVLHRDSEAVVLTNDGALFPGDVIAGEGAYQIHLALKNQSGGGIDPHAGHKH